jgi:hypothetical protein
MENVRYHQVENLRFAPALLEMPVLEEMIEAMTLPRYHHTSDDQRWSKETLSFLSCSISGSLQNLNDVSIALFWNLGLTVAIASFCHESCIAEETNTADSIYS